MRFSEWTSKNIDRAIDKACRGSEVPLRAFWCKVRIRMSGPLRQAIGKGQRIAMTLVCMVKLIYLNK